ncbi:Toll/interleukin-1 receptor homology (TIR) domain [Arabidopsis suecica]|uniref:Toll/interleukin-1 receptor homology (TIR) domain n=1 Tax=Arabidopsis suecica TaxID=45249 RepID=A0A8T2BUD2_ARASU|nr:Toll/interleukin-1 receptor homology (TIR) domain [Arabidopsis suecica]
MASSSSSPPIWKYDVFLSFRGEDTRKNIVSHLHKELVNKGIVTFKDDKRLEIGDSISEEISRAIQDSRFALVILSKNYASSSWCMDELLMIMDLHLKKKIKVVPIFYGVDPSHVRHQTGSFTFDKHRGSKNANKVTPWRKALRQIASIAGKDFATCENEALMIEEIVEGISNKLLIMQPVDFSDIVGMEAHMELLNSLLSMESEDEVRMIGIWGMGGIGKTTIARCLFDRFSRTFPARCFLENVSKIYRNHNLSYLREKFLSTTLGLCEEKMKLSGVELGPQEIMARFGHRKVFVVLDNVDDMKQVHALAKECCWFGPGSRIIITTRDKGLLKSCEVRTVYEVKCLDTGDALQLFNQLAFEGGRPPSEIYEKLSIRASWLTQGLPAAIEAYGLFFRRMTSLKEWDDALCRFVEAPDKNVMEILKISYDGLEETDKNVFLHVACLFNGEPLRRATTLLDDGELQVCLGLKLLAEKSLIEITAGGYIKIHNLVDQTARAVVNKKSVQRSQRRSVLWDPYEIYKLLERNDMSEPTNCMALHMCDMVFPLHLGGYKKYNGNLKFLKVYKHSDHIKSKLHLSSDDTNLLSSRLRLLHWDTFPLTTFPCRFRPRDLVEVSLHRSNLTIFWKETVAIPNLRRLDLSGSENLEQLPDLSMAVNLEELITRGCKRLKRIPESISNLTRLTKLDVSYCDELKSCHITIRELIRGRRQIALYISGKNVETEFIADLSIGGNIQIQMLWLDGNADHLCFSAEQEGPDELTKRKKQQAPHKKPMFCGLGSLMRIGRKVKATSEFHSHEWMMQRDQQVPDNQQALEFYTRTRQAVQSVSEFHHGQESVRKAQPKSQPSSKFHGFNSVDITRFKYSSDGASFLCYSLSMFPCLKELILINLNIEVIPDDVCGLQFLEKLDWSGNDFETLPKTMNQLHKLKYVSLRNCCRLRALPELVQLETVKLSGCMNLQSLLEFSHAEQEWGRFLWLELWVDKCKSIRSISDQLRHFIKLSYLDLTSHDFETLPSSIEELSSLRTLCLNKCKKLKSIKGLPLCLKFLYAHGCEILKTVSLPLNHSIKHLDLSHCFCLKQDEHLMTQFLNKGEDEEDSLRFAFFPGTEVPSYFGKINTGNPLMIDLAYIRGRTSPKMLGFDGCIMIACERPFDIQFSPFSYDWDWGYERYFYFYLKPDFFPSQESSFHSTEDEEEAVKSDHLVIIRGLKNFSDETYTLGIRPELQFSEDFKSPPAELKSCGFRLIWDQSHKIEPEKTKRTSKSSSSSVKPKIETIALKTSVDTTRHDGRSSVKPRLKPWR